MKPSNNNSILWRRAPASSSSSSTKNNNDDGDVALLPVVSSPRRATTTTDNASCTPNQQQQQQNRHHHHHLKLMMTMISSPYSFMLKQSLYCQWMTVLMAAVFVSTLSTFRWSFSSHSSLDHLVSYRLFSNNNNNQQIQQQQQYPSSSSMMTMMMTIQYPSSVTLSKLDSDMIHALLPPPPKQKVRKNEEEEKEEGGEDIVQVVHFNPDFGGIDVRMIQDDDVPRTMFRHTDDLRNSYLSKGDGDDEVDFYYLVDDDVARNPYNGFDDDKLKHLKNERSCRKTSWHYDVNLNCNNFHEFDFANQVLHGSSRHLGAGSFRDVFVAETAHDKLVFKESSYENAHGRYTYKDYHFVRKDGVIAAQLQPHPLLVDTYGWCQLSLFGEYMPMGDMYKTAIPTYRKCKNMTDGIEFKDKLVKMSNLTGTQKLEYALQMAESIAVLNNFEKGVIVHDDVQLVQFLLAPNGKLKLNDFNRMEVMYFDEENREYCRYRNNPGHGPWRAPEEYYDYPLDEKIDTWSLGNMFYSLMTGMFPFYHECSSKGVQKRVKNKETPFIDPRWKKHSFAEAALVKVMRQCWAYHPADRIDISSMILQLREAVEENETRRRSKARKKENATSPALPV